MWEEARENSTRGTKSITNYYCIIRRLLLKYVQSRSVWFSTATVGGSNSNFQTRVGHVNTTANTGGVRRNATADSIVSNKAARAAKPTMFTRIVRQQHSGNLTKSLIRVAFQLADTVVVNAPYESRRSECVRPTRVSSAASVPPNRVCHVLRTRLPSQSTKIKRRIRFTRRGRYIVEMQTPTRSYFKATFRTSIDIDENYAPIPRRQIFVII